MRDPIEYRKARFIMYTVIKAIQYKDVRSLLKMMRIVYEELKNNMKDVEKAFINLRHVNMDSIFSVPPFENMKIAFENTEYHVDNLVNLFKNILEQLEYIEDGRNLDVRNLINLFPSRNKKVVDEVVMTATPRLVRSKMQFEVIKENFNDFVKQYDSVKDSVYELMSLLDLYLTLTHGFVFRNFTTDQELLLDEMVNEELGNLVLEFKLNVSASNYIIWNTKNFKKDYKIMKAMMTEFVKGIKKGGL